MDATTFTLITAAVLVVAAFAVREVRLAVRRRIRAAYEAGGKAVRALDYLLAGPEQPTKAVLLERGDQQFPLKVRSVTDGEVKFLQRTPQGMQGYELVSMALVEPKLTSNEVRQTLLAGEVQQLVDVIMEFSGYGDVPA